MFTTRHSHPFSMANIVIFFIATKKNAFFLHPYIHIHTIESSEKFPLYQSPGTCLILKLVDSQIV